MVPRYDQKPLGGCAVSVYGSSGKNEKTKVVIKLQNKGSGAPVREPRVDEDTHKAMLAYYYKYFLFVRTSEIISHFCEGAPINV